MPIVTLLPYPHTCYQGELIYDADFNEWQCDICRRKYVAPQIVIKKTPMWKPWTYDVPHLCLPTDGYWMPELDYRC